MKSDVPRSLYQYRSVEGKNLGYLKQLILSHELYLGSPAKFNDPFDSKVAVDFTGAKLEDWRRFFRSIVKNTQPKLSYSKREKEVTRIIRLKHYQSPERLQAVEHGLQSDVDKVGVACFSEVSDSILMWSHYAASHTGVCVEFGHTKANSIIALALPITYSADYAPIKAFADDTRRQVELVLLTKSDSWSYEREWRIVDFEAGVGARSLPATAIKSVILGCCIEPAVRSAILSCVFERMPKLLLFQAKKSNRHYGLEFELVEDIV